MKKFKWILPVLFIGMLIVANCDWTALTISEPLRVPELPEHPEEQKSEWQGDREPDGGFDPYFRPAYNMGSCKRLSGTVHTVTFFVNDMQSSWTEGEARSFTFRAMAPALRTLEEKAGERGVDLKFENWQIMRNGKRKLQLKDAVSKDPDDLWYLDNLLPQLARQLGFRGQGEMDTYFKDYFDTDQVVYYVVFDDKGRSFAAQDHEDRSHDKIEFCVLFSSSSNGFLESTHVVGHETMHLFGAEDYYDPNGDLPERKKMAEEICPDDVMLERKNDFKENTICDITAYTVGWLSELPPELLDPRWSH